jgi:hypothetical protein
MIVDTRWVNKIQGVNMGRSKHLTHFIFVYDLMIFWDGVDSEGRALKDILEVFFDATSMLINDNKFVIYFIYVDEGIRQDISSIFNFSSFDFSKGIICWIFP